MTSEKEVRDQVDIYQLILSRTSSDARYVGVSNLESGYQRGGFIRLTDSAILIKWTTGEIRSGLGVSE